MPKKIAPRPKSGLHFEQIPVAQIVKKIPPPTPHGRKKRIDDLTAEPGLRPRVQAVHFHGVHFYNDPDALCRIVADFLCEGLEQGAPALVIATPAHGARIALHLRGRGIDLDDLSQQSRFVILDAEETMRLFMTNGIPNPGAFRRAITSSLARLHHGREHRPIRAYGEMVDLLWKAGRETAAIRLETLWNQLGTSHDFKLLCGYAMGNFYKGPAIEDIHDRHSHLLANDGGATALRDLHAAPLPLP